MQLIIAGDNMKKFYCNKEKQVGCQTDNNFHEVKINDITCKKYAYKK